MKIIVGRGANLEVKDEDGETPVFVASTARDPEMIKVDYYWMQGGSECHDSGWLVMSHDGCTRGRLWNNQSFA